MCKNGWIMQGLRLPLACAASNFYVHILQSSATLKDVAQCKCTHAHIIKTGLGLEPNIFVHNNLANMYVKCGLIKDARHVFDKMPYSNVVSWNGIIAGYARNGEYKEAMELFRQMREAGMKPNQFTFGSMLSGVASMALIEEGKILHSLVVKSDFEFDLFVQSALLCMYAKCGCIEDACAVFDKMSERDVVSWNAIIAANVFNGHGEQALTLFHEMQQASILPNQITYGSILNACSESLVPEIGKLLHAWVIKSQTDVDVPLWNALIDMYAKCGSIEDAYCVFDRMATRDEVSWNAILAGHSQNGHHEIVLTLFQQMQMADVKMDEFTFATLFKVCAELGAIEQGMQVHTLVIKTGLESNLYVGTALVEMLVNCRMTENAIKVFTEMPKTDVVAWSVVIAGYAHQGEGSKALELFCQMRQLGLRPDDLTLSSVLKACAGLATLQEGKKIHGHIIHWGFESSGIAGSSLIDMYTRSGSIDDACTVFRKISREDVTSWNAMISGYAQHGYGKEALELFREMQKTEIKPDHITFVGILYACTHLGLVDEGCDYFNTMNQRYGVIPREEHYACMVDLLSRSGHLEETQKFVTKMPFHPKLSVWRTLLAACRIHGNLEIGERIAEYLFALNIQDSATYVLLSNLYSAQGRWNDAAKVRKMMNVRDLRKEAGLSWIEIKGKVHVFLVGD